VSRMAELDAAINSYREAREALRKVAEFDSGVATVLGSTASVQIREQVAHDVLIDAMMALCISAADDLVETILDAVHQ